MKKEIGTGGSGAIVFLADWNKQEVATKLYRVSTFTGENDFEEFEHEISLLGSLRHPNIVLFYGAVLAPPHVGIVIEYCSLGTLADYITKKKGTLTFKRKLGILLDICRAVMFLHGRGVIHRDLKLSDFGLSKRVAEMRDRQTRGVGTSYYMAPEVTRGEFYDEKCDVFSFSMIMMEMLTESINPYNVNSNYRNIEVQVATNPFFRPQFTTSFKFLPEYGPYISLMQQAWNDDPEKRPTMGVVLQYLEQALN